MGWEVSNGSGSTERLPVDSRFVAKMERLPKAKSEQANSRFVKKWRSGSEYSKGATLNPEERMVYNYVADLVASGQVVDPINIESDLMVTSDRFLNSSTNFYEGLKSGVRRVGGDLPETLDIPLGSYVEGVLSKLQQKGLVRYA